MTIERMGAALQAELDRLRAQRAAEEAAPADPAEVRPVSRDGG